MPDASKMKFNYTYDIEFTDGKSLQIKAYAMSNSDPYLIILVDEDHDPVCMIQKEKILFMKCTPSNIISLGTSDIIS
jgi:hypothetical protein